MKLEQLYLRKSVYKTLKPSKIINIQKNFAQATSNEKMRFVFHEVQCGSYFVAINCAL